MAIKFGTEMVQPGLTCGCARESSFLTPSHAYAYFGMVMKEWPATGMTLAIILLVAVASLMGLIAFRIFRLTFVRKNKVENRIET